MSRAERMGVDDPEWLDRDDTDDVTYCFTCCNTGEVDCYCGGDLCVCRNQGTEPCPDCSI